MEEGAAGTGIRAVPDLIFAVAIGSALALNWLVPLSIVPDAFQLPLGGAILFASVALFVSAVRTFQRHNTTMAVKGAPTTLLTSGAYGVARNPIYLSMIGISAGIGVAADAIWMIPALAGAVWYLRRRVIDIEECYLSAKFGRAYDDYKLRVLRWL